MMADVIPSEGAFATVDDLAARWRALSGAENAQAAVLLDDASDLIRTTCRAYAGVPLSTLKRITCAIVKRAMLAGGDAAGISQHTETAGSYSESYSYSNPAGDLYLTAAEKTSLGVKRQRAFSIDMSTGKVDI